jgi:uncharacterized membrane protein YiaA
MNPHVFEAIMLLCFSSAWPFSIAKLIKTKKTGSRSLFFFIIIIIGYLCGIVYHYTLYLERGYFVNVIFLYGFNALMVSTDLTLTLRYRNKNKKKTSFI